MVEKSRTDGKRPSAEGSQEISQGGGGKVGIFFIEIRQDQLLINPALVQPLIAYQVLLEVFQEDQPQRKYWVPCK